ncbi:MAG: methyl-accepting chemotaxis protein [Oscillospiraceae bacterium]|jgi:methyl-accepting chemotaxis protein|nr:methyl-accepting chemotaxis protein [Oscillospiraceae bacterium]
MKNLKIRTAILLPVLAVLIVGIGLEVILIGSGSSKTANDLTSQIMTETLSHYAYEFDTAGTGTYSAIKTIAPTVEYLSGTENGREEVVRIMQDILAENSSLLALWTCWEPNAFDGRDGDYAGQSGHDGTGRFIPYIYRSGSGTAVIPLTNYDENGDNDYYQGVKNSQKPYITEPYYFNTQGKETLVYSVGIPIMKNGRFVGAVGADIDMTGLNTIVNSGKILSDGYLFTLSPAGTISTHADPDWLMKHYTESWMKDFGDDIEYVTANGGKTHINAYSSVLNQNIIMSMEGVMIGDTGKYWVICGIVPQSTATASSRTLIFAAAAFGIALIIVISVTITVIVQRSLRRLPGLTATANAMAEGDITNIALETQDGETQNEIELLARAFASMVETTKRQVEAVQKIAEGDLSIEVNPKSDDDLLNKALHDMIETNNGTFLEIQNTADMVNSGAQQLSDGAQQLAQASIEQSSSVEQLTASIKDVSVKTKENEARAIQGADVSSAIMQTAEKGTEQMDMMITAVEEINEASLNISKVMKNIDDIAFQTNILSLNAAVEAARAGAHGKGFAVVADEVRSLAAKSAEAARESGELIENSMQKAELGVQIAKQTADILGEIVSGIRESNQVVGEIPVASKEQSVAIDQINTGINEVASTVQQNSATAQQTAAASEQMRGQAHVLDNLVSQFKLKTGQPKLTVVDHPHDHGA